MAFGIEFTSRPGKAFVAALKDPLNNYVVLETGVVFNEVSPGRYRGETTRSGIVWLDAADGAVRALGFADLDAPEPNGFSEVKDSILRLTSTGTGAHALQVAIGNGSSAVAGVIVNVKQGSVVVAWGYTNGAGQVTFNLASGNYSIALQSQPGYSPIEPQPVVVPDTVSVAITLTPQTLTPPTTPGLCTVRFVVLNNGSPVQGAIVYAELEDQNPMVDSALVSRVVLTGVTNAQGMLDLVMIQRSAFTRGGVYRIRASDAQGRKLHDRRVTVPTLATTYAEDLPDA